MIYEFGNQFTFALRPRASYPFDGVTQPDPHIAISLIAQQQSSDVEGETHIIYGEEPTQPVEIRDFIEPGFHYLDTGMKHYFSDIRIPTRNSTRFLRTKVSGMRRGIQIWSEQLKHGRVKLPVMAISRGSHQYNPEKFNPPHHHMRRRYLGDKRVQLTFRPVPWLVEYTLTIWAETKRDAEYAIHQILTRYNPLAEFVVSDGHIRGTVTLRFGSCNDTSDKEASPEQLAKVKYELATTAEAWLSLPEQVVPTVLGTLGGIDAGGLLIPWNQLNVGAANG